MTTDLWERRAERGTPRDTDAVFAAAEHAAPLVELNTRRPPIGRRLLVAAAFIAVAGLAVWSARPDSRSSSTTDQPDPKPVPSATAPPESGEEPTAEPDTPTPEPVTAEPSPAIHDVPTTILLPEGWELIRMFSIPMERQAMDPAFPRLAATAEGPLLGPALFAYVNERRGWDDLDDDPSVAESVTPGGITVRVAPFVAVEADNGIAPDRTSLQATFAIPSGVVTLQTLEVSESDLLGIVDLIEFEDGVLSVSGPLPAELGPVDLSPLATYFWLGLTLTQGDQTLEVTAIPTGTATAWSKVAAVRSGATEITPAELSGGPVRLYSSSGFVSAVVVVDGHTYILTSWGNSAGEPPATVESMAEIAQSLTPHSLAELGVALGHSPRADVYKDWFDTTPLPAGHGLDWLRDGPSVAPVDEVLFAHQRFRCAWVEYWEQTGDPAALDELGRTDEWGTAETLRAHGPEALSLYSELLVETHDATTAKERSASTLRTNCTGALGPAN